MPRHAGAERGVSLRKLGKVNFAGLSDRVTSGVTQGAGRGISLMTGVVSSDELIVPQATRS